VAGLTQTRALLAVALIASASLLAGCGQQENPQGRNRTVTIGYAYGFGANTIGDFVAFDGLAAEHGITLKPREIGDTNGTISALARGDVDIAYMGIKDAINAVAGGADIRVILRVSDRLEDVLVSREEITNIRQLAGKRIATFAPNDRTATLVIVALREAGLDKSDVKLSVLGESPRRAAALSAGRIDATPLEFIDYQRLALQKPRVNLLARMADLAPPTPLGAYAVTAQFAKQNSAMRWLARRLRLPLRRRGKASLAQEGPPGGAQRRSRAAGDPNL
jgi:ABC-type nitrate/sulfonate/bicarbonate transport system substrate-binding protein